MAKVVKPIFIVGSGRSGTTLLKNILNAHKNIFLTEESSFFVFKDVLPKSIDISEWFAKYSMSLAFSGLRINPCKISNSIKKSEISTYSELFSEIMIQSSYKKKNRYGDKTPFHVEYIKEILKNFSDSSIINVTRHPVDVVSSIMNVPWGTKSIICNSFFVRRQLKYAYQNKDLIFTIKIEDIIKDKERTLKELLLFLGEDWDEAVMHHHDFMDEDVPQASWMTKSTKKVSKQTEDKAYPEESIFLTEAIVGKYCKRFGYHSKRCGKLSVFRLMKKLIAEIIMLPVIIFLIARIQVMMKRIWEYSIEEQCNIFYSLNKSSR